MSTATINTVTKMLENLPEVVQERAVEHLREYLEEISDEMRWNENFNKNSGKLSEMARNARKEIAEGKAEAMDFEKL
ncbi:MAG: hypothetical protein LC768_02495 [Acidobacteria bacterium]|nr:hypothetical protein [Acidobacteriota bacterium]MCA1637201.1 hypothetical protein [Acidobacteriota bacterium]